MQASNKIRIGITGQAGFVGTHLFNTLGLTPERYERIPFEDAFFDNDTRLRSFVRRCDVIVHLAGMNRHPDPMVIYATNLRLVQQLINAMEVEEVQPHVLFASSIQEERDNPYGNSKKEGRLLFETWAEKHHASFTGMIIPNVFGPFGMPNYNSFIATFCYKLTHGESPQVIDDSKVKLIYVASLVEHIIRLIENKQTDQCRIQSLTLPHDMDEQVSHILQLLESYKTLYLDKGYIPEIKDKNEKNLFYTFHSYIDHAKVNPHLLEQFVDERGSFVETIRFGTGGQSSFSTTLPGVTRGNHYHTRKIERFTVIKGKARIQLRKIGSSEVMNFYLNGKQPAYVDMPVWHTHNITNIGEEELYTQFWINEWYNKDDGDTFYEKV